jgi:hypothetical protein
VVSSLEVFAIKWSKFAALHAWKWL